MVRDQTFFNGHLLQRECLRVVAQPFAPLPEQRSLHLAGTLYLPQSVAAMYDPIDLVQGPDAGQQCEFFPVER
jgi:hypothetical protein